MSQCGIPSPVPFLSKPVQVSLFLKWLLVIPVHSDYFLLKIRSCPLAWYSVLIENHLFIWPPPGQLLHYGMLDLCFQPWYLSLTSSLCDLISMISTQSIWIRSYHLSSSCTITFLNLQICNLESLLTFFSHSLLSLFCGHYLRNAFSLAPSFPFLLTIPLPQAIKTNLTFLPLVLLFSSSVY